MSDQEKSNRITFLEVMIMKYEMIQQSAKGTEKTAATKQLNSFKKELETLKQ